MEQIKFSGINIRNEKCLCCISICNWFVQILVWISIAYLMIFFDQIIQDDYWLSDFSILFAIIYITYIIMATCCSKTFSFLINKQKTNTISQYMNNIFLTKPTITFKITNYHEETYYENQTLKTRRVDTNWETEDFNFLSSKDISNDLILDVNSQKTYIKLYIDLLLSPADNQTSNDYETQKEVFINKWKNFDSYYEFTQFSTLDGLSRYNLIKIKDEEPSIISLSFYLVFVLLIPAVELYKLYFDSLCYDQDFKVKKEISTINQISNTIPINNFIQQNNSSQDGYEEEMKILESRLPITEIRGEEEAALNQNTNQQDKYKSKKN